MKLTKDELNWYGRNFDYKDIRYFDFSASGFDFCFTGTKAEITIKSDASSWDNTTKGVLGIYISNTSSDKYENHSFWSNFSGDLSKKLILTKPEETFTIFESDKPQTVCIKVLKLSECAFSYAGLVNVEIEGKLIHSVNKNPSTEKKILFIGDSITCGYGIEGVFEKDTFTTQQERPDLAYAFQTAKKLNADFNLVSWSGIGLISKYVDESINIPDTSIVMPGLFPYTDKSCQSRLGLEPEVWDNSKFSPDIVVINLGTNDASFVRKIEERRLSYVNSLFLFIENIHRIHQNAKICCCLGVMGQDLCDSIDEAINLFKKEFPSAKIKSVKFPVQSDTDGIAADWHPSSKTHIKMSEILAKELLSF
ncbi:MAG: SGNH/GDSL hydrolase family protein [Treponema sp.]|jgi:lysophospholipase L1-like esterase|nr:SGNH/GDSL hydrolase family protein [Treponema sp.]